MFPKVYLIYLQRLGIPHAFSFSFLWKSVSPSVHSLISSSLTVSCGSTQGIYQVFLSLSLRKLFFPLPYHSIKTGRKLLVRGFLFQMEKTGNPWIAEEVSLGASRSPDLNFKIFWLWTFVLFVGNPDRFTMVMGNCDNQNIKQNSSLLPLKACELQALPENDNPCCS